MKIKALSLVLMVSLAQTLHAEETSNNGSSVADSASLSELFSVVSEVAADGPSLSYFGWTESTPTMPERVNCYPAGLHDATEYLVRLVDTLDWATPEQRNRIDQSLSKGLEDFREILGAGILNQCDWELSEQMSSTRVTQFENQDTGYQITFSLGFED
jgi:hypothetical protein